MYDYAKFMAELERKQRYLDGVIKDRKVKYNYHDAKVSRIEAVFARGDRKLCAAMEEAHRRGMVFDSWEEHFDYEKWLDVFAAVARAMRERIARRNKKSAEKDIFARNIRQAQCKPLFFKS